MHERLEVPTPIDNSPGGLACPPWLLLLDDPAVRRVMAIGPLVAEVAAWFHDEGATVVHVDPELVGSIPVPDSVPDLVVVAPSSADRFVSGPGLDWLQEMCGRGASAWLPWRPTASLQRSLDRAGFGRLRHLEGEDVGERRWRRPPTSGVVLTVQAFRDRPPGWLVDLARAAGIRESFDWSLRSPRVYPSQKAVVSIFDQRSTRLSAIVKVTRHGRFEERLQNEAAVLAVVNDLEGPMADRVPDVLATAKVGSLVAVAEEAVAGRPFLEATTFSSRCGLARDGATGIAELADATRRVVPGEVLAAPMRAMHERFVERLATPTPVAAFLLEQVELVAQQREVPAVLWHGDIGTWNLFAHEGQVCFLDWESAVRTGPPLWDLFHFARSYAVRAGRRRGMNRTRAIQRHLLATSALNATMAGWVDGYQQRLQLAPELVEPLFHTGWMCRAVKEGLRLGPGQRGHYGPLCELLVAQREAPGVRRLVLADRSLRSLGHVS